MIWYCGRGGAGYNLCDKTQEPRYVVDVKTDADRRHHARREGAR